MATAQFQNVDASAVGALFLEQFGKELDPGNYHDVTLAINRFLRTSLNTVLVAGFWQGEIGPNAFGQTQFGVIVFTLDSIGG